MKALNRIAALTYNVLLLACLYLMPYQQAHSTPEGDDAQTISRTPSVITYCIDPDWLPYEAIEQGQHIGMSSGYVQRLAERSGLNLQFKPTQSWRETLRLLREGSCHLSPMLNKSPQRQTFLAFSDVYFYAPNVLVSRRSEPFLQGFEQVGERRVAIPRGYRLLEYLERHFPTLNVVEVESEKAGLMAVAEGEAEIFVGSLYSVNAYVQQQALLDLKINGWAWPQDELRMAVIPSLAGLLPKINKALSELSEADHLAIQKKWNNIRVIENHNYTLAWQLAFFTLVIIGLLASWNLLIRRYNRKLEVKNSQLEALKAELEDSNKELEFLSNHDPLTKLYNRHFFSAHLKPDNRSNSAEQRCSLILLDIDHFKEINDQYGHNSGDSVLQELSSILCQCVREQDVVGRWGGEEFVILSQQDCLDDAYELAKRIAGRIRATTFSVDKPVTCSFGIARLQAGEAMTNCFERADKALYRAKKQGRDCICIDDEQE
ncbi:diguanylate cyclase [Lacimicrobium sp. SS2-24]|uniref:diguanylate cyclase n=1 Tax=Lacimicrobium sp. SS2-24 TaxID=2005569 RepID=UPI000B4AE79A|nr:diguanylate cyclase [Lacimicrobium sp. SS2-24]